MRVIDLWHNRQKEDRTAPVRCLKKIAIRRFFSQAPVAISHSINFSDFSAAILGIRRIDFEFLLNVAGTEFVQNLQAFHLDLLGS